MNPTGCHDCDSLTGGACPQHSTRTIVTGPTYPAGTLDAVVEIARLRAENAALRGQVAALVEAFRCAPPPRSDDPIYAQWVGNMISLRAHLTDAALEHDAAVRAQAFEEAFGAQCKTCRAGEAAMRANDGTWFHGPREQSILTFPCHAAALREKARKP